MMAEEEESGMMLPATILTKDSVEKVGQYRVQKFPTFPNIKLKT
jgi:hypothetical protein